MKDKTIFARLANARSDFHKLKLKKSGFNKFSKYYYFELGDFIIPAMEVLRDHELVTVISFADVATLTLYTTDGGESIVFASPIAEASLKGCHPIQNLGAVQTYLRRYLWTTLMEVVEHDEIDSAPKAEKPAKTPAQRKQNPEYITPTQCVEIDEYLTALEIDRKEFLKAAKAEGGTIQTIPVTEFDRLIKRLKLTEENRGQA